MFEEFKNKELYIYLDDVSQETVDKLQAVLGDICWASGTPLNGWFTRKIGDAYLSCKNNKVYYQFTIPENKQSVPINTFIHEVAYPLHCEFEETDVLVTQIKTVENDGYAAVQVGFQDIREKLVNKPRKGMFAKAGVPCSYVLVVDHT